MVGGDRDAAERAYASIHAELRRLAARQLGRNAGPATLTPTALVNEAYLKLANGRLEAISDRRHFFNLAARAMRQMHGQRGRQRDGASAADRTERLTQATGAGVGGLDESGRAIA